MGKKSAISNENTIIDIEDNATKVKDTDPQDGVVSDLEIELLEAFRNEMNLISIDDMAEYDIVDIVDSITDDKIVKKIVLFELLSLACVDSDFSEDEKNVLQSIKERWTISDELYDKLMKLASGLVDLSNQISDTLMTEE